MTNLLKSETLCPYPGIYDTSNLLLFHDILEFLVHVNCPSKVIPDSVLVSLFWCPYMVINVGAQYYNGWFLPEIIMLTLFDYVVEPF